MPKKKIILGLIGEIASGKGSAVKYLERKYKAKSYRFSTPIRNVLDILKLEINRRNMQFMSLVLRENFGEDLFAKIIAEEIKKCRAKIVVIDGIRRPQDIVYLKKIPAFKLIYISADIKTRYRRIIKRKENKDEKNKSFIQFKKDEQAETEIHIKKLSKTADYKIKNNKSYKEFHDQLKNIINKINKERA